MIWESQDLSRTPIIRPIGKSGKGRSMGIALDARVTLSRAAISMEGVWSLDAF